MSSQAGVHYFDGRPVCRDLVLTVNRYLRAFGTDGGGEYLAPGVAMVYRALHVTPEDARETQPFTSDCDLVVTWDGRLDNRDDLFFQLSRDLPAGATDVALVTAAIARWGHDAFVRLLGDWSLVAWNGRTRELTFASDYAGSRSLYYWEGDGEVHWSTSLAELVDRLRLRDDLEPRFIVGQLTSAIPAGTTPYRGVRSVLAGHFALWSTRLRGRQSAFWDYPTGRIELGSGADYEIALRTLFASAVKARLRSTLPVWAELSGGLDSSSIVCMADRLRAVEPCSIATVETVSYITDSSPESDERRFIKVVEEKRGRRGHYVMAEDWMSREEREWSWVTPFQPSGVGLGILDQVRRLGGRVLMTGNPGDVVMKNFISDSASVVEALAALRIRQFLSLAREWAIASRRPIWPVLYLALRRCASFRKQSLVVQAYFERLRIAPRTFIEDAAILYNLTASAATIWHADVLDGIARLSAIARGGNSDTIAMIESFRGAPMYQSPPGVSGITYTHPFFDRTLVEFVLGVPAHVMSTPGRPRDLMKRALGDLLPPRIADRFSKGYARPFIARKLKTWLPAAANDLNSLWLVRHSYVDREHLHAAFEDIRAGRPARSRNAEAILRIERWLAAREHGTHDAQLHVTSA